VSFRYYPVNEQSTNSYATKLRSNIQIIHVHGFAGKGVVAEKPGCITNNSLIGHNSNKTIEI
jgi:hypothetical protein